jgi:hypothetical protein
MPARSKMVDRRCSRPVLALRCRSVQSRICFRYVGV